MKVSVFLFVMAAILLCAGTALSQSQKERKIIHRIDSVFHVMVEAAEKLEYDRLSAGVDDRHKAGFISGGIYYSHFDSLLAVVRKGVVGVSKQSITIEKQKISVLSNSLALLTAHGKAVVELSDGRSFDTTFDWSFVYELLDNQWKVIHSHQTVVR